MVFFVKKPKLTMLFKVTERQPNGQVEIEMDGEVEKQSDLYC